MEVIKKVALQEIVDVAEHFARFNDTERAAFFTTVRAHLKTLTPRERLKCLRILSLVTGTDLADALDRSDLEAG